MLTIEFDREEDGRWMAEVPELPGEHDQPVAGPTDYPQLRPDLLGY